MSTHASNHGVRADGAPASQGFVRPRPTAILHHETVETVKGELPELCEDARERFGRGVPVLVLLGDSLTFFRRAERLEAATASDVALVIKRVAHIPVAVFVAAERVGDGSLDEVALSQILRLDSSLGALQGSIDMLRREATGRAAAEVAREILDVTQTFVDRTLTRGVVSTVALDTYATRVGPSLLKCASLATHLQLVSLHQAVSTILRELDPSERRAFQVVVVGDHEARERSLGLQYFARLLGESPGAEERVVYGEGLRTPEEARALVGARRLDGALAKAFFGDPRRLHRDVLGDAAKEELQRFDLAPLS